jgi:hypothetical protein
MHKHSCSQGASHAASCRAVLFPPFFDSSFRGLHSATLRTVSVKNMEAS